MAETDELFAAVNYVKNKVDTLEKIEILRMQSDKSLKEEYKNFLLEDKKLLDVYKSIDGKKNQNEIASEVGISPMEVSRRIKKLLEKGFIEFSRVEGKSNIYTYSVIEKAYRFKRLEYGKE